MITRLWWWWFKRKWQQAMLPYVWTITDMDLALRIYYSPGIRATLNEESPIMRMLDDSSR